MTSVRYACEFDHSGYAIAARRYVHALRGAGVDVNWQPLVNTRRGRIPVAAHNIAQSDDITELLGGADDITIDNSRQTSGAETPSTTLVHCVPGSWGQCFEQLGGARRIGQTVWETESMPTRWLPDLSTADELWVPTAWNADTVRRHGWNRPIHVVPHTTARRLAPLDGSSPPETVELPIELPKDVTVVVAIMQWERRKRPDLTIEAFLRAFSADDPAILVVKTGSKISAWSTASAIEANTWWQTMHVLKGHAKPGRVVLDSSRWTDQQIAALIGRADCYLSLTASEGWGIGAFDAAAQGVPVIMTGWGGQRAWLPADAPGIVPYVLGPVDHPDTATFEPHMTWAHPDIDAAASLLRELHDHPENFSASAASLAISLHDEFSPERVGAQMAELLS